MNLLLALVVGTLFGAGVYLMLRRTMAQLLLGLAMAGNAANLLIFTAAGVIRNRAPIVPKGASVPPSPHADPIPQALILTAIVISFAVIAFTLALADRLNRSTGQDRVSELHEGDE